MKIAYCIHSLHVARGIERVISFKANGLSAIEGNEIYIITARLNGRPPAFTLDSRVRVIDLGVSDSLGMTYRRYRKKLRRCLEAIKPDIAVSVGDNTVYALADTDFGGRRVCEYHFSFEKFHMKYGRVPFGKVYAEYRRNKLARAVSKLDAFVVLTESDCHDWSSLVPRTRFIYNPPTITNTDILAGLESRTVIALGQLSPQKNYPDMLSAWARVYLKHPDWTLEIYGEGKLQSLLEKTVKKDFPDGGVILKGRTDDVKSALMGSSMLVLSSKYEGFPLVLLEAAVCGVPAVSYNCPKGPAEIIGDSECGILVPEGDIEALSEGICQLIENPEKRKRLGKAVADKCSRFNQEIIISQWQALWNELLKEPLQTSYEELAG